MSESKSLIEGTSYTLINPLFKDKISLGDIYVKKLLTHIDKIEIHDVCFFQVISNDCVNGLIGISEIDCEWEECDPPIDESFSHTSYFFPIFSKFISNQELVLDLITLEKEYQIFKSSYQATSYSVDLGYYDHW